jgi:hypothetical protein
LVRSGGRNGQVTRNGCVETSLSDSERVVCERRSYSGQRRPMTGQELGAERAGRPGWLQTVPARNRGAQMGDARHHDRLGGSVALEILLQ